ncbi:MAG: redoxin domain-containing protein [Cyclobacteriaceae bacterium]
MRYFRWFLIFFLMANGLYAQKITNFELVDANSGNIFSLDQHRNASAIVLVFSNLGCPFSKLYEDRLISLNGKYAASNVIFAMVNPHSGLEEEENEASMAKRAGQKGYGMPFLSDPDQKVTKMAGMTKIPEALVISSGPTGFSVAYRGAIDNNAQSPQSVSMPYLENAIIDILDRKRPSPASTRAVGCNIRLQP